MNRIKYWLIRFAYDRKNLNQTINNICHNLKVIKKFFDSQC